MPTQNLHLQALVSLVQENTLKATETETGTPHQPQHRTFNQYSVLQNLLGQQQWHEVCGNSHDLTKGSLCKMEPGFDTAWVTKTKD